MEFLQDILDEILKKKINLENVKDCGDAVCQRSTDPKVSNNMMQLSVKYQGLVSQAKVRILLQIQISLPWYLKWAISHFKGKLLCNWESTLVCLIV